MAVIKDLVATLNRKSQPNQIVVHGLLELADETAKITVTKAVDGRRTLVLDLTALPSGGKGAFVPFTYSEAGSVGHYTHVTARFDGTEETVTVSVLG